MVSENKQKQIPVNDNGADTSASVAPRPTLTTLRATPLLSELPNDELIELTSVSEWLTLKPGSTVVRQNEVSTSVLFILSGHIKIMRGSDEPVTGESNERRQRNRPPVMLALLGPGDMMGELAVFLDNRRTASVVTLTPCQLVRIPSRYFMGCLTRHPPFTLAIMRKMARRIIEADRQVELMRGGIEGRIHALLRQCRDLGVDTERWISNAEIARMVGATRVAVSQIMSKVKEGNPTPPPKAKKTAKLKNKT
ncbi:MAG: Crp/Fnr family transcriptional regulator [Rhodocyclaceae bacterium]|nr:Crp/Fnr family transcriptional regulator [Rhodocyclaceae bacterium]MDZ4214461.1 Crp/Fnr family transcriptional regulator [Rhodocyclaceae bacterium]